MDKKSHILYYFVTSKKNIEGDILSMKSVTQILGGSQILLGLSFDIQDCFEDFLSENHRCFLSLLSTIEDHLPKIEQSYKGRGRFPYRNTPILRAFLAKSFFKLETIRDLIDRLKSDSSLRQICGFTKTPSESTFSRRLKEFSEVHILEQILNLMVSEYHKDILVGHISRDSTAISTRERPMNKKKDVNIAKKPKRKRGRPRKGEVHLPKVKRRLTRQLSMKSGKALKELNTACSWGCKKNSQGNVQFWKGHKLHLDVTDMGIPITAVVTGANVHDSQAAIPMEKMTARKITYLYSLMDAAYDAPEIRLYNESSGRVPIIDYNKRRKDIRAHFDPAMKERFKIRSTVERSNAHLKDWLLPSKTMVKGHNKVTFTLMTGVVCLAAIKILQYFILPKLETAT